MNDLNKTIIEETFAHAYDRNKFRRFIRELLSGIEDRDLNGGSHKIAEQFVDYIDSYRRIGKYTYNDGFEKIIDVLEVKLKKNSSVDKARAMQRNFVARYLNGSYGGQHKDAALVAFISENSPDWRFSFIKMDYKSSIITKEDGTKKRVIEKELTPAKRFSFLVGENEYIHTAQKQLYECLQKSSQGTRITLEDLVEAFDIEKVSKEFFAEYKKLYLQLRDELKRIYDYDKKIHKDFDEHNIKIDDFAKKTLGQIVFLYFVQKKGWLGVKANENWGTGDKKFLTNLFNKKYVEYNNFFNDILEPLFYRALARDRGNENDNFAPLGCRIPFLNGGLFEPINGYGYAQTDLTIDNSVFAEIFKVFDLYNFTVKEDEPLEKEVAIDPEMLGKVFENLLPENEQKGNGAFYTRREIVHHMSQASLVNYLYYKINMPTNKQKPARHTSMQGKCQQKETDEIFEEKVSKEDISRFLMLGDSIYKSRYSNDSESLPKSITNNEKLIYQALKEIKICDPAIGSGAFPVGMMNELVRARMALGVENKSAYEIKREIIENNLYGVDLDDGAVEIAKLRFWLSLIVDEEDVKNIKPLPNLDYKIMQGNSLLTEYEGIDFDDIVEEYKPKNVQLDFDYFGTKNDDIVTRINNDMYEYIKTSHETDKRLIKERIENSIVELVKNKISEKATQGGISWEKAEQSIRDFAQNRKHRNFFPWKLFFADVFMSGGFDVVIGNPPYLGEAKNGDTLGQYASSKYYQGKMNIWYLFTCYGLDLLKSNGILNFIAPNNWNTAAGSSIMRNKILKETQILEYKDFGNYHAFESADQQTMIFLILKSTHTKVSYSLNYQRVLDDKINISQLEMFLNNFLTAPYATSYDVVINRKEMLNKFITFSNENLSSLMSKIKKYSNYKLQESDVAQGIVIPQDFLNKKNQKLLGNSYNVGEGIFVLSTQEKDLLCLTEKEQKDLIRPLYTSVEIGKYKALKNNKYWIIYTSSKFKNAQEMAAYPNIKSHLDKYKDIITSDNKPYGLHRARKEKFFIGEKIISLRKCLQPSFAYVNFDCYVLQTFFVLKPTQINLKYLTGLLNSKLIAYWFREKGKIQGNHYQIDKEPLINLPLYKASELKEKIIGTLVDGIQDIKNADNYEVDIQKKILEKKLEMEIDIVVYKLYNLTYEEVKIIDPDFSLSEQEYLNFDVKD